MRKVLTFLGASLCLAWVVPAVAQQAPDMFKDVPRDHWAYSAVESLRSKGIVIGYPDGYFRGKRTLTRYEFAVALDRALRSLPEPGTGPAGPAGAQGEVGPVGPQGEQGPPGVTPEELDTFRKLAQEFRDELASLGNNMNAVNRKLDQLAKDVAELRSIIDKMPKISGGVFWGVRSDRANGFRIDQDGRVFGGPSGLVTNPIVTNMFRLGVDANIPGGATVVARLDNTTYRGTIGPANGYGALFPSTLGVDAANDTYVDQLEINTPFNGLGRGSKLTIGRFPYNVSHLTLWKPTIDSYLTNPFVEDEMYRMDGFRLTTNFGSLGVEVFGAKTNSVTDTSGMAINNPVGGIAGIGNPEVGLFGMGAKPVAQGVFSGFGGASTSGQMVITQLAGANARLGINQLKGGYLRLTAIDAKGAPTAGITPFTNLWILGADGSIGLTDRLSLDADWGKTITGRDRYHTVNPYKNNAFNAMLRFKTGSLNVAAGYRYIDPMFYAPGYWGRIGNWINPTNIQGPTFRAGYDFSPSFGLNVGGDFYTAARNEGGNGGLNMSDDINRVLVGLRWDVAKNFRITGDWEGVYYSFGAGSALGNAGKVHPTEHYITLGTGYNLTSNTLLKLQYQMGMFNGHNALLGGTPFNNYNFNTFSSTVAVKF